MRDMQKKDYFNIPNMMGYFRILLLPVFLCLYFRAETSRDYMIALAVLAVSYFTDFFDGKIARRFDMVTDWGKMLDPIADKLTQGAIAAALILRYRLMAVLVLLFFCKEVYMGVMGLYLIRRGYRVNGATWYGKVGTAVLDVILFLLLLFPGMPSAGANILIFMLIVLLLVVFGCYVRFHLRILKS